MTIVESIEIVESVVAAPPLAVDTYLKGQTPDKGGGEGLERI